ncbi:MAG: hypothetical protein JXB49_31430 [Bacteroidales bacterium]|nr:hypothetical protein [Bacteroidales bacterium]
MKANYFISSVFRIWVVTILSSGCTNNAKEEMSKRDEYYRKSISIIQKSMLNTYAFEGSKINPELKVINLDGDTISINQLLNNNNKIIVYLTASMCTSCIEIELKRINKAYNKQFICDNIIFLIKTQTLATIKAYSANNFVDMNIFLCLNEILDNHQNINSLLVFITNKSLSTNMIYFPEKSINLDNYYSLVNNKYFKQ